MCTSSPPKFFALLNDSMDAAAFKVYVSKCLVPQLWKGAVVIMDNLPAHKVKAIAPLIEAVGAKILYLSPYSRPV
ncbi:transposase [Pleurocapsales cyanobacterium LEGE 10410]|nr:transposase [Pleurocapsales cyanobacterium LEGE 10410]